ncbi:hypothetical protein NDU88_003965 [Pleurodeles waltl]|uniref:Secreted protein n=1 Tax=Pleurodeles waltl TaxID=8319 RepID=A0AAV7QE69_PLEWA|nr:hypothetical protein NDU88_003965 [Pleurodeles waltl]
MEVYFVSLLRGIMWVPAYVRCEIEVVAISETQEVPIMVSPSPDLPSPEEAALEEASDQQLDHQARAGRVDELLVPWNLRLPFN